MSRHLCAAFNFHTKLVCVLQELTQDHMPSLNANTNVLHSFSKARLTPTLVVDGYHPLHQFSVKFFQDSNGENIITGIENGVKSHVALNFKLARVSRVSLSKTLTGMFL